MRLYFEKLLIVCKQKIEELDLSHQITFFHGKIGSGKSTIARLIDFCFGGELENTAAINSEFIAAKLFFTIGNYNAIVERGKKESTILVTWKIDENVYRLDAPIAPSESPILNNNIYSFSDLIFFLLDMTPLKIAKNKLADSPLERLSIRNFFWYSYLKQEKLDNTFFRFEEPFYAKNSKSVLKFVLGYFTENLNDYEIDLATLKEKRKIKQSTISELNKFLNKFEYSLEEIESQIEKTKKELFQYEKKSEEYKKNYKEDTHSSDRTRIKLIRLNERLDSHNAQCSELSKKIEIQKSLKAELILSTFKLDRASSANKVFAGLQFEKCPCCGEDIEDKNNDTTCSVCKKPIKENELDNVEKFQIIKKDVESRIKDVANSIFIHEDELEKSKKEIKKLFDKRIELNRQLNAELSVYESSHFSNIKEIENKISQLHERIRNLLKQSALPKEIENVQKEVKLLLIEEQLLQDKIIKEREKLNNSDNHLRELENVFAETLDNVGMPGFNIKTDNVCIDRRTWSVKIISKDKGNDYEWCFDDAGSGGKKTLFNVCFLLSIHIVAETNNLPLPSFMIIDTPMKNIDHTVNQELFENFYRYLYSIANTTLSDTNVIIIDNFIIEPTVDENIDFTSRYLTPDEEENPPLISYYRGA